MKNNDLTYVRHALDSVEKIEIFLGDVDYEEFSANDMMVSAVVRELEVIGEAVNNLSQEFKSGRKDIPFRDISDMRNFLIHEYFGVNIKVVWDTCKEDIPALKDIFIAIM